MRSLVTSVVTGIHQVRQEIGRRLKKVAMSEQSICSNDPTGDHSASGRF